MTDLQSITQSLRAAVDGGDLGLIADAISALERFEAPEPGLSYQRRQLEPEETSLPNQFSITLVVNRKKYEATWYDAGHDTEGFVDIVGSIPNFHAFHSTPRSGDRLFQGGVPGKPICYDR